MDSFQEHSRRHRILTHAQRLMLERGFAATSVNDICKAAGVTKGAFFHHFDSKESMTREVFERYVESFLVPMAFARDPHSNRDPLQRLRHLMRIVTDTYAGESKVNPESAGDGESDGGDKFRARPGCLIGMFAHEFGAIDDGFRDLCARALIKLRNAFRDELSAGFAFHRPGEGAPAAGEIQSMAESFVGAIQGAVVLARATGEARVIKQACDEAASRAETLVREFGRPRNFS